MCSGWYGANLRKNTVEEEKNLIQEQLKSSDKVYGKKRLNKLKLIEHYAAKGGSYLPVWLVTPKAWAQNHISKPEFDSSGTLLLNRLKKLN